MKGASTNQRRLLTVVSAACVVCLLCALLLEKPCETCGLKLDAIPDVSLPKTDPARTQTEHKELERRERAVQDRESRALQELERRERALQEREERALQELERNELEVEGLAVANLRANLDISSEVSNVSLTDNCCRIETRYEPSPWEAKWARDISKYNVDMTKVVPTSWPGCRVMAEDDKQTQQWLDECKVPNDAKGEVDPVTWSHGRSFHGMCSTMFAQRKSYTKFLLSRWSVSFDTRARFAPELHTTLIRTTCVCLTVVSGIKICLYLLLIRIRLQP